MKDTNARLEHYVHIPNPLLPEQRDQVLHDLKTRLEKAVQEQQTTMIANQQLEKEIQDLQLLVKEYEAGLEVATSKLRTHAVKLKGTRLLSGSFTNYIIIPNVYRARSPKDKSDYEESMKHY